MKLNLGFVLCGKRPDMSSSSHYPAGLENFAAQSLMIEKDITMKGWLLKKSGREKMALTPRGQCKSLIFCCL